MCSSTNKCMMITVLVLVILVFIINFVIVAVPVYHYDRPDRVVVGSTGIFSALISTSTPKKVYVGFFGSRIEYDVGSTNLDTVDLWKKLYPNGCSLSDMEDMTRALQGFWCILQIFVLVLLVFTSVKVCCKQDFSHWWVFSANIIVLVSIIIVSGIMGHQFNYEFCGSRSINDSGFDLSAASFFLFVNAIMLFVSQILACLASFCYRAGEDAEPEVVVVHHHYNQPDVGY